MVYCVGIVASLLTQWMFFIEVLKQILWQVQSLSLQY